MITPPTAGTGASHPARLLAPFLRRHWPALGLAALGSVVLAVTELAQPFPLKLIIDRVADRTSGPFTLTAGDHRFLLGVAALALSIALFEAVASYLVDVRLKSAGERITHELRLAVYAHLQRLSLRFHDRRPTGDLVTRLTGDVSSVGDLFSQSLGSLAASVLLLVGMAVVSVRIDPVLALAAFSVTPVLSFLTVRFRRMVKALARHQRAQDGELASLATEALGAVRAVRALGAESLEHDRLAGASRERLGAGVAAAATESRFGGFIDVTGAAGWALVLVLGMGRVASGAISPGDLVVMSSYTRRLYKPLRNIAREASRVARAMARAERVAEVLVADELVEDRPGGYAGPRARGEVVLEAVSFAYTPERAALYGVTLRIPAGQRVALVGRSGAGKSTVAALVSRLYDAGGGRVLLDGRDVRDCSLVWLRSQVGLLLQESVLFSGTVADNIAYATPSGRMEVEAAARAAGAHDFIAALPDGYDTWLGSRGVALSGGQRQRLAIARTLLRNPPVLVLDEPTAGLDRQTEAEVMSGFETLAAGRTTIVITHSPTVAGSADHVVVLADGRVAEQGTPAELLRRPGAFRRLLAEEAAEEGAGESVEEMAALRPRPGPSLALPDDPALPSLPVLLDADAMTPVLARSLFPGTPDPKVDVARVRYRPGARLVVRYNVAVDGMLTQAVAVTAAHTRFAGVRRLEHQALVRRAEGRSPALHLLTHEPELGALIHWLPVDPGLPALAEPAEALMSRLEAEGLPTGEGELTILGYTPGRRAVLGLDGDVLKLYADETHYRVAGAALERVGRAVLTPGLEALLPELRATVSERLPGVTVHEPVAIAPRAGALLAALHTGATDALPVFLPVSHLAAAAASASVATRLLPHLTRRITRLLADLEAAQPTDLPLVASHGDFQRKQLLDTPHGLAVVDVDHLCAAPAALDPATYAACLYGGSGRGTDLEQVRAALEGLRDGYGATPPALAWMFACAVIRRSRTPFHRLDPDWPERIETMVATAEALCPR
ncbi:MAG: ABC transporter transmembrane domain-containing protein [Acidimicrobiia bacterium]